jgi:hypothetical protein
LEEAMTPAFDMRVQKTTINIAQNKKGSQLSINSSPLPNELQECKEDDLS